MLNSVVRIIKLVGYSCQRRIFFIEHDTHMKPFPQKTVSPSFLVQSKTYQPYYVQAHRWHIFVHFELVWKLPTLMLPFLKKKNTLMFSANFSIFKKIWRVCLKVGFFSIIKNSPDRHAFKREQDLLLHNPRWKEWTLDKGTIQVLLILVRLAHV